MLFLLIFALTVNTQKNKRDSVTVKNNSLKDCSFSDYICLFCLVCHYFCFVDLLFMLRKQNFSIYTICQSILYVLNSLFPTPSYDFYSSRSNFNLKFSKNREKKLTPLFSQNCIFLALITPALLRRPLLRQRPILALRQLGPHITPRRRDGEKKHAFLLIFALNS